MSSIEERLVRDIAAVTGGVVVTESDLRIAREALDERIGHDRRARRLVVASAAAVAALLVILGVSVLQDGGENRTAPPADPGPTTDQHADFLSGNAPTADLLQGVWRLDNGGVLMRFAPPDLISFDNSGRLFEDPGIQGRYAIEGDLITVTVDGGRTGCGGQEFEMRAGLPEPGILHFVFTKPGTVTCDVESQDGRWVMEQVLPPGPVFRDFALSEDPGATWRPVTEQDLLHGSWFVERSGYVVELAPNNEYHVAGGAGEQLDYGAWELRGSQLVLTSWPDSVQCDASDELVLGGLEAYLSGTNAIRGNVKKNTCGGAWADAAWFLIPDARTR